MAALLSDSKDFCGDGGHCASLSTSDFTGDAIRLQRFRHTERRPRRSKSQRHSSLSQRKSSFFADRPPAQFCALSVWHCIIWGPFFMCGKELCLLSQRFRQPAHRSAGHSGSRHDLAQPVHFLTCETIANVRVASTSAGRSGGFGPVFAECPRPRHL